MRKEKETKVAIVTGASAGIGEATAIALALQGWRVYAGARRTDRMEKLREYGIRPRALDLTDKSSVQNFAKSILDHEGRVDLLVNNAGYGSYGPVELVSVEEAKEQFEVNLFGLARLTQLLLPQMRKQKSGKIINLSSIGGSFGEPHGAWYHATKFALEGFSDSLRMELAQFGIDVVVVKPGAIQTEWSQIAQSNLSKVAEGTAYEPLALKHAQMLRKYDGQGSDPSLIANLIVDISAKKKPNTRYVRGRGAKTMMCLRGMLSDRVFDSLMLSLVK